MDHTPANEVAEDMKDSIPESMPNGQVTRRVKFLGTSSEYSSVTPAGTTPWPPDADGKVRTTFEQLDQTPIG